jgi:hypothetical protein
VKSFSQASNTRPSEIIAYKLQHEKILLVSHKSKQRTNKQAGKASNKAKPELQNDKQQHKCHNFKITESCKVDQFSESN